MVFTRIDAVKQCFVTQLDANRAPAERLGCNQRGARPAERGQHNIAGTAEGIHEILQRACQSARKN